METRNTTILTVVGKRTKVASENTVRQNQTEKEFIVKKGKSMYCYPSSSFPDATALVAVEIAPIEEEADELATLAATEQVYLEIQHEATHLEGYATETQPADTRGADLILLIGAIAGGLAANKAIVTAFPIPSLRSLSYLPNKGVFRK